MTEIQTAGAGDLPQVLALLEASGLPTDGLALDTATVLVARDRERVVGSAALEVYGSAALLRSVAVDQGLRGQGLGLQLTEAALDLARRLGLTHVYLLTETAESFFPRFGFRAVPRTEVPETVRGSVEFVSACPASAVAMALSLHG